MSDNIKRAATKLTEVNVYLNQLDDLLDKAKTIVGIVQTSINQVQDIVLEEEAAR